MKGILFKPQLIPLVLSGRKTMTRRVVKPQPMSIVENKSVPYNGSAEFLLTKLKCPYGIPGDKSYVRETHYRFGHWRKNGFTKAGKQKYNFIADGEDVLFNCPKEWIRIKKNEKGWFKRPSIFMPRWASRLTLEIVSVRVERLQEITEEDARKEGAVGEHCDGLKVTSYRWWFERLWDSINKDYPWSSNPWVFVYEWEVKDVAR